MSAFIRVAAFADEAGSRIALAAPRPMVAKVFDLTGLGRRLAILPGLSANVPAG